MKLEEDSSGLKLEIGKVLADLEQTQKELKICEGEKADLVTSKLSLEKEIKVSSSTVFLNSSLKVFYLFSYLEKPLFLVMHLKLFNKHRDL